MSMHRSRGARARGVPEDVTQVAEEVTLPGPNAARGVEAARREKPPACVARYDLDPHDPRPAHEQALGRVMGRAG